MFNLKRDLRFPLELESLFSGIEKVDDLAQSLKNKNSFVKSKIDSCGSCLKKTEAEQLVRERFISEESGMVVVKEPFSFCGSFQGFGISITGPVGFEKDVTLGRSTIIGPAYISEKSNIFDSVLRAAPDEGTFIGKNCNVWDYSEINRSLVGDQSMIHTCNINDSIVGPFSNFGATSVTPISVGNCDLLSKDQTMLEWRIVFANHSNGNRIKILDPTTDEALPIEATHFGAISGTGVSCASGTIIYPGTIIGAGARIVSAFPITGYIQPDQVCSLFLVITKRKDGTILVRSKGTLVQPLREYFASIS